MFVLPILIDEVEMGLVRVCVVEISHQHPRAIDVRVITGFLCQQQGGIPGIQTLTRKDSRLGLVSTKGRLGFDQGLVVVRGKAARAVLRASSVALGYVWRMDCQAIASSDEVEMQVELDKPAVYGAAYLHAGGC